MKKIMIAAAIVCAAVISQAATVKWDIGGGKTQVTLNGTVLAGHTVQLYLVGLGTSDDVAWDSRTTSNTSLSKGKLSSGSGTQPADYNGTAAGGGFWTSDGDLGREYYMVITATDSDGKAYTYTSSAIASSGLGDKALGSVSFSFTDQVITSGTDGWVAVPEPTSGFLLLLGMAGLALKRKRT